MNEYIATGAVTPRRFIDTKVTSARVVGGTVSIEPGIAVTTLPTIWPRANIPSEDYNNNMNISGDRNEHTHDNPVIQESEKKEREWKIRIIKDHRASSGIRRLELK